jgi:hypothetical protein
MIVNKPQFDTDKIKPGQAYWFKKKDYRHFNEISAPAIIQAVKPLTIVVNYWDGKAISQITIDINSIVDKSFTLEPMEVVVDKIVD